MEIINSVFRDILCIKCYKHKSCNEEKANYLGKFHATLAVFLRQTDLAYIMKIKWIDYFWVFCKIDK